MDNDSSSGVHFTELTKITNMDCGSVPVTLQRKTTEIKGVDISRKNYSKKKL